VTWERPAGTWRGGHRAWAWAWTWRLTTRRMLVIFKKKTHLKAQELIFLRRKIMTAYNWYLNCAI